MADNELVNDESRSGVLVLFHIFHNIINILNNNIFK